MDIKEQLFNHWGQRLGLVEFVEREGLCMLHKLFEGAPHTWVLEEGNQPLSMLHLMFPSTDCWDLDSLWKVSIIQPCDSMEPLVWLLVWLHESMHGQLLDGHAVKCLNLMSVVRC